MKLIKVILLVCFFNIVFMAVAEDLPEKVNAEDITEVVEIKNSCIAGFIFNTNNLLLDLDTYQGGLGFKLLFDDFALRGSLGGAYESGDDKLNLSVSFAFECPVFKSRVVPYIGAVSNINYDQELFMNGYDWTKISSLTVALGGIIGAELYIFEYLSVFAEYEISINISNSKVSQRIGGTVTETVGTNYQIATGMGNNASIGIVLYVQQVFDRDNSLKKVKSN